MWACRQHHWQSPLMAGSCLSLQHPEQCPAQVLKNERNNEWMGELCEMWEGVRIGRATVQSGWVVRGMQSTGGEFIMEEDGPFSGLVSSMWTEVWLCFSKCRLRSTWILAHRCVPGPPEMPWSHHCGWDLELYFNELSRWLMCATLRVTDTGAKKRLEIGRAHTKEPSASTLPRCPYLRLLFLGPTARASLTFPSRPLLQANKMCPH